MRNHTPKILLSIAAITFFLPSSKADILAFTDFNDTEKSSSSQTMTGIDWVGDDEAAITANPSVTTTANANVGYFTSGFGATGFAPDQNIENEGPWAATFELNLSSGAAATLTSIAFDYAALNNSGATQGANFRPQNFDVTVNGVAYDIQRRTTAVNGALTFMDAVQFNTGPNLIVITASEVSGPGYNMAIDNLSFNGDLAAANDQVVEITKNQADEVVLTYTGVLQQSDDLVTWVDVNPAPVSPVTIPTNGSALFYRSRAAD